MQQASELFAQAAPETPDEQHDAHRMVEARVVDGRVGQHDGSALVNVAQALDRGRMQQVRDSGGQVYGAVEGILVVHRCGSKRFLGQRSGHLPISASRG